MCATVAPRRALNEINVLFRFPFQVCFDILLLQKALLMTVSKGECVCVHVQCPQHSFILSTGLGFFVCLSFACHNLNYISFSICPWKKILLSELFLWTFYRSIADTVCWALVLREILWIYAKTLLGKRLLRRIPLVSSWKCFRAGEKPKVAAAWGWYTHTLLKGRIHWRLNNFFSHSCFW